MSDIRLHWSGKRLKFVNPTHWSGVPAQVPIKFNDLRHEGLGTWVFSHLTGGVQYAPIVNSGVFCTNSTVYQVVADQIFTKEQNKLQMLTLTRLIFKFVIPEQSQIESLPPSKLVYQTLIHYESNIFCNVKIGAFDSRCM